MSTPTVKIRMKVNASKIATHELVEDRAVSDIEALVDLVMPYVVVATVVVVELAVPSFVPK